MLDLLFYARKMGLIPETSMSDHKHNEILKCDYPRPSKDTFISDELEARRIEFISHPANAMMLLQFMGWSLEDYWNTSKPYNQKIWTPDVGRILSWLGAGMNPGRPPISKVGMNDVLRWWQGMPGPVKDLVEPIIIQWKIFVHYCDDEWHQYYKEEEATVYNFESGVGVVAKP
jgi:hypothetical protein